ncbi:MAG: exosortase U, partial [Fuerstia sp.]|nr:exosortase U [Fuerstiella sp.]
YAFSKWELPLDKGWPHEALGVATYALALGLSLSTDRLFMFLVPASHIPFVDAGATYNASGSIVAQFLTLIGASTKRLNRFLNQGRLAERLSMWVMAGVLVLLFAPLASVNYARVVAGSRAVAAGPNAAGAPDFVSNMSELVTDNAVPLKVDQWKLVNTERINRTPDDPQGTNSTVFTFAGEGLTATFSVDGYYPEWHDLAYCYTALDWKLKSQQNYKDASTGNHATQLSLYTDDGRYSVSYFSCFDSRMQSVKPGEATIGVIPTFSVLMDRMPWSSPVDPERAKIVPPIFQLQLMCGSSHDLLDYERENLQKLFSVLSEQALQSFTKASP